MLPTQGSCRPTPPSSERCSLLLAPPMPKAPSPLPLPHDWTDPAPPPPLPTKGLNSGRFPSFTSALPLRHPQIVTMKTKKRFAIGGECGLKPSTSPHLCPYTRLPSRLLISNELIAPILSFPSSSSTHMIQPPCHQNPPMVSFRSFFST
jgi:hypothetical protein